VRAALRRVIIAEIILAARLGAFGDWWAASAARRLRKLSANIPGRPE
jgi:hypothetical protein